MKRYRKVAIVVILSITIFSKSIYLNLIDSTYSKYIIEEWKKHELADIDTSSISYIPILLFGTKEEKIYRTLGTKHYLEKKNVKAEGFIRKALDIKETFRGREILCKLLKRRGDITNNCADKLIKTGIATLDNLVDSGVEQNRIKCSIAFGYKIKAINELNKIKEFTSAQDKKRYARKSMQYLDEGLLICNEDTWLYFFKMSAYQFLEEWDNAINMGEISLGKNPNHEETLNRLIKIYLDQNKEEKRAIEYANRLLSIDQYNQDYHDLVDRAKSHYRRW